MKTTILLLLIALSICSKFHHFNKFLKKAHKNLRKQHSFRKISKVDCEKCEQKGNCPLKCKKYLKAKMCDECEEKGECPLSCKNYFMKKLFKKCIKCEKEGNCPLECKDVLKKIRI